MSAPSISRAIAGGGAAGAAATILVWVGSLFGVVVPDYVSAAIVVVVSFLVGMFIPSTGSDHDGDGGDHGEGRAV